MYPWAIDHGWLWEDMVRPFGALRRIKSRDPNIVLFEVTELARCLPPPVTRIFNVCLVLCSLSLPPQLLHPQRDTESTDELGRDMEQTILKGSTEEEQRAQIARESEMRNADRGHFKSRSSSPMED